MCIEFDIIFCAYNIELWQARDSTFVWDRTCKLSATCVVFSLIFLIFIYVLSVYLHSQSSNTVFSAGLDILEMYKPVPENLKRFWTNLQDVWLKLYGSSFPTAAAINVSTPKLSLQNSHAHFVIPFPFSHSFSFPSSTLK